VSECAEQAVERRISQTRTIYNHVVVDNGTGWRAQGVRASQRGTAVFGGARDGVRGWRLEAGGWRLEAGGRRLGAVRGPPPSTRRFLAVRADGADFTACGAVNREAW